MRRDGWHQNRSDDENRSIVDDDDDDDHGRVYFNDEDKFRFEQFRTAQATTVPIPGDLEVECRRFQANSSLLRRRQAASIGMI